MPDGINAQPDFAGGGGKRGQGEASRSITPERRVADLKLMIANSKRDRQGVKGNGVLLSSKTVGAACAGMSTSSFYAGEDESKKRSFLRRTSSSRSPVRATKDLFDPRSALSSVALNLEKKDPSRNEGGKL